jgi:sporulation protein YlmC with PRC-barrel domain
MTQHTNRLINLPVYTQSNQYLGKVCDLEVDPATQIVLQYHVKSGGLIKELLQKELIIGREQVVSISAERMVVEDTTLPIGTEDTKKVPVKGVAPAV